MMADVGWYAITAGRVKKLMWRPKGNLVVSILPFHACYLLYRTVKD
jgi:hypothetical protein